MSGLHIDGIGWNALGVWCGECSASTCEGCKYEYRPFQGFSEKVIAEFKKVQKEDEEFMERELKKPYENMPVENPIPANAWCGECNTDTCEGCPYREELIRNGENKPL